MDQEEHQNNEKKESDLVEEATNHLKDISLKLDKVIDKIESKKKRDGWDKFQIISSFFSSVLIAGVGLIFTLVYNDREKQRQIAIQQAQLEVARIDASSKQRVTELQALISLTPLLASADNEVRKNANNILKAIDKSVSKNENPGNLLANFISVVNTGSSSIEERINANEKIADIAVNASVPEAEKKKAINTIVKIAASQNVPTELKQAANSSLSEINKKRLEGLQPEVMDLAIKFIEIAREDSMNVIITQGYVSPEKQDSLYAIGRTKPGTIRTNARGGTSKHNFGLAFDVAIYKDGKVDWSGAAYKKLGEIGRKLGLTWGGDFKFKDEPHFA